MFSSWIFTLLDWAPWPLHFLRSLASSIPRTCLRQRRAARVGWLPVACHPTSSAGGAARPYTTRQPPATTTCTHVLATCTCSDLSCFSSTSHLSTSRRAALSWGVAARSMSPRRLHRRGRAALRQPPPPPHPGSYYRYGVFCVCLSTMDLSFSTALVDILYYAHRHIPPQPSGSEEGAAVCGAQPCQTPPLLTPRVATLLHPPCMLIALPHSSRFRSRLCPPSLALRDYRPAPLVPFLVPTRLPPWLSVITSLQDTFAPPVGGQQAVG